MSLVCLSGSVGSRRPCLLGQARSAIINSSSVSRVTANRQVRIVGPIHRSTEKIIRSTQIYDNICSTPHLIYGHKNPIQISTMYSQRGRMAFWFFGSKTTFGHILSNFSNDSFEPFVSKDYYYRCGLLARTPVSFLSDLSFLSDQN